MMMTRVRLGRVLRRLLSRGVGLLKRCRAAVGARMSNGEAGNGRCRDCSRSRTCSVRSGTSGVSTSTSSRTCCSGSRCTGRISTGCWPGTADRYRRDRCTERRICRILPGMRNRGTLATRRRWIKEGIW